METTKKNTLLKDTAVYATANYLAQAIGMVNSIVLRRFMGPVSMGVWSFIQVILGYCGYASFGTTRAMARDYPYLRGRGEHEKAEDLKDMTLTFSMIMSLIPACILLGYLFIKWPEIQKPLRIGLAFLSTFLFLQRFHDLIITLLRSDKKFELLGHVIVLNALGGLAISFLLVAQWNIYGLFMGTAGVMLGCLLFIFRKHPYRFRYFWNVSALWKELKLGIPLVASSLLFTSLTSLDKLLITKKLGFHDLGLFSVATLAHSYILSLPMMFAHVWYPNLQEVYGSRGTASGIKNFLLTPVLTLSLLLPFLCGIVIFFLPVVTHLFLKQFSPGIPAMKFYLVGSFFLFVGQFSGNFLVTLDKYLLNLPILFLSLGVNLFFNMIFIAKGWGIQGVAGGTALSFLCYGLGSYLIAAKQFSRFREGFKSIARMLLVTSFFFGAIFGLDRWVGPPNNLIASAVLKMLVFTVLSGILFAFYEKKTGLLSELRRVFLGKRAPGLSSYEAFDSDRD